MLGPVSLMLSQGTPHTNDPWRRGRLRLTARNAIPIMRTFDRDRRRHPAMTFLYTGAYTADLDEAEANAEKIIYF